MVNRDIAFLSSSLFLPLAKKVRLSRTAVSRVLTDKCHGTDLSQGSRIQIRANGSGCLTRDTKDVTNEDQQDSTCPLSRQHVIRSNYMGKSIEAKKKVCANDWLNELWHLWTTCVTISALMKFNAELCMRFACI